MKELLDQRFGLLQQKCNVSFGNYRKLERLTSLNEIHSQIKEAITTHDFPAMKARLNEFHDKLHAEITELMIGPDLFLGREEKPLEFPGPERDLPASRPPKSFRNQPMSRQSKALYWMSNPDFLIRLEKDLDSEYPGGDFEDRLSQVSESFREFKQGERRRE